MRSVSDWTGRFLACSAALFLCLGTAAAKDLEKAFEEGNRLYEQGRYEEAVMAYRALSTNGISAPLLFNLGNAHFRAGQLGLSIYSYHRALQLRPRDPDIQANLRFARKQVGEESAAGFWDRWIRGLSLNEWTALASASLTAWLLLLTVRQLRPAPKNTLVWTTRLAGIATTGLSFLALAAWVNSSSQTAVIIVPEAVVRNGPLEESPELIDFKALDGTELSLLDQKDGWVQVTDRQARRGWTQKNNTILLP